MSRLTFLGTGTSQGVPVISCRCWTCISEDSRDRRLRSSVMIEHNGVRIVIDAGPDFRTQMLREDVRSIDAILLTHEHRDHIGGLDDVRGFNYSSHRAVDVYGRSQVLDAVRNDYAYAFGQNRYPGVPDMNLIEIGQETFEVNGIEAIPILGKHYITPVTGFRIGSIGYLTDFNHIDQSEIEKLKGVDVFVVNALQHEAHLSHFTLDQALHLSWLVGARESYFTHISHQMGRYATQSKMLPEGNFFAYDGLVVDI